MMRKTIEMLEFNDDGIRLEIAGTSPAQAFGMVDGKRLYFCEQGTDWVCAISENADVDPQDMTSDEHGYYKAAKLEQSGLLLAEDVKHLILGCIAEYRG